MNKTTLFVDLDNTLIYSNRRQTIPEGILVEQTEAVSSYMSPYTWSTLNKLLTCKSLDIVPITTRTLKQYSRLKLPRFERALIDNGGILLENNEINKVWLKDSMPSIIAKETYIQSAYNTLNENFGNVRDADGLFYFVTVESAIEAAANLPEIKGIQWLASGCKLYAIPDYLTKSAAITRYNLKFGLSYTIAAGDCPAIDYPMANNVNLFIYPKENVLYSDTIMKYMKENIQW